MSTVSLHNLSCLAVGSRLSTLSTIFTQNPANIVSFVPYEKPTSKVPPFFQRFSNRLWSHLFLKEALGLTTVTDIVNFGRLGAQFEMKWQEI